MLREYIYDRNFQVIILNNMVNILNYIDIVSFSDSKIIIKYDKGTLLINGSNLVIGKMLNDELLIKGKIINIEFR